MNRAGGGFLIFVGIVALWIALTGKLDLFAEFWGKLTASSQPSNASSGSSSVDGQSLEDAIKALPNPPKVPLSILRDPILR